MGSLSLAGKAGSHRTLGIWRLPMVLTKDWSTLVPVWPLHLRHQTGAFHLCRPLSRTLVAWRSGSECPASFFWKGVCITVRCLLSGDCQSQFTKSAGCSFVHQILMVCYSPALCRGRKGEARQTGSLCSLKLRVKLSAKKLDGRVQDGRAGPDVGCELSLGS